MEPIVTRAAANSDTEVTLDTAAFAQLVKMASPFARDSSDILTLTIQPQPAGENGTVKYSP